MKYILLAATLTCTTLGAQPCAEQEQAGQPSEKSLSREQQKTLDKAKEAVRKFRQQATCKEYFDFAIYMENAYGSWYAAVNPEIQLRNKLTANALKLVETLKTIIKPFERPPQYPIGGSKLSNEGHAIYGELIPYAKTLQCIDFNQLPDTRYR